jgi:hypothetical protein
MLREQGLRAPLDLRRVELLRGRTPLVPKAVGRPFQGGVEGSMARGWRESNAMSGAGA